MNEQQDPTPEETPEAPAPRPKFRFPGASSEDSPPPAAPASGTAPQPLQAPNPTSSTPPPPPANPAPPVQPAASTPPPPPVQTPPPAPVPMPEPPATPKPIPQATVALTPAQQATPPAQATPVAPQVQIAGAAPAAIPPAAGAPAPGAPAAAPAGPNTVISGTMLPKKKKGMSTATKSTIAAVVGLAVIFVAFLVVTKIGENEQNELDTALLAEVTDPAAKDLPTTTDQVSDLLRLATDIAENSQRQANQRLLVAKASDGTDIDKQIAEYAANDENQMISDIRVRLFQVLQGRKSPTAVPYLIEHARSSDSEQTAGAALDAIEKIATSDNLGDLLNIMRYTNSPSVRQKAKRTIASVAKRTDGRSELAAALKTAYDTAGNDEVKRGYLELLGSAGGDVAADIVRSALADEDKRTQIAAIAALRNWPDDSMFEELIDYATGQEDDLLRSQSFGAAYAFLRLERERDEFDLEDMWTMLAEEARTEKEKRQIIDGMAKLTDDWAFSVVEFFEEDENDRVSFRAEQARERMEERRKRIEGE